MLKFMRNKLVTIVRKDKGVLSAHGTLDDDIYGLELNVTIKIPDLEILSIEGKWNRWTTPECPRAIPPLQEAVGLKINEKDFSQKVKKDVGRRACRHYANLLMECCSAAGDAADLIRWQEEKDHNPSLGFSESRQSKRERPVETEAQPSVARSEPSKRKGESSSPSRRKRLDGSMVIDLHTHTSPASPCSSVAVDDLIEEAKRIGMDGICLTDHNHLWERDSIEALRKKHGFLVLRGNEITTDQGDVLVFGLEEDIKGIIKLEELRQRVRESGGFVIAAHPFRGFLILGAQELGLGREKAMERPLFNLVDAVEVMNSKVTQKENGFAREVAEGLGLPMTGGSDAHDTNEAGVFATRFFGIIRDEKDLVQALRNGDFEPVAFRKDKRGVGNGKDV